MEWPISWQKVKDSGVAIFDIADYGLVLDPNKPETMQTTNVSILSDIEQALNDGKTVFLKVDTAKIGANGYAVGPIIGYGFSSTYGFTRFSNASLITLPNGTTAMLGLDFRSIFDGGVQTCVKMEMHKFLEDSIS